MLFPNGASVINTLGNSVMDELHARAHLVARGCPVTSWTLKPRTIRPDAAPPHALAALRARDTPPPSESA